MKLIEWGALPADTLSPLYRREEATWRNALAWDTSASWATVEAARTTWGLPGLVCCDAAGHVQGWTFFMRRDHAIDVGGLVADSAAATEALIDGLLDAARGALCGFIYATAPGLDDLLPARGIVTERYAYLTRATNDVPYEPAAVGLRAWRAHDSDEAAALLKDAYGSAGRLFAHDNSLRQWRTYVENLLAYSGCGLLRPDLSRVVDSQGGLAALALVTALASDTAHLAQLAVRRELRRSGIARTLLGDTLQSAHSAGYRRMSLLVSRQNAAACRLYGGWGFEERGVFLALDKH